MACGVNGAASPHRGGSGGSVSKQERQSERTRTRVKAVVHQAGADKSVTGFTTDISREGLFIQTRNPLPPGTPIKIELTYSDGRIDLEGVVVRAERVPVQLQGAMKAGMGIRIHPSPDMSRATGTSRPARVPLGSDVVVFFGSERLLLKLHDLSASGAALLAEEKPPDMTFVRLHLKLPSVSGVIELEGIPVGTPRQLGEHSLIAINFLDPPAEFVSRIEALLEERADGEEE